MIQSFFPQPSEYEEGGGYGVDDETEFIFIHTVSNVVDGRERSRVKFEHVI